MNRVVLLVVALGFINGATLDPRLARKWDQFPNDKILGVIIHMKDKADLSSIPKWERKARLHYLQDFARRTQANLISFLQSRNDEIVEYRSYWIFNGLYLKAKKSLINQLLDRNDIRYIEKMDTLYLSIDRTSRQKTSTSRGSTVRLKATKQPRASYKSIAKSTGVHKSSNGEQPGIRSFNWNIDKVKADSVWIQYGLSGDGVILANLDTGVDVSHPALASKYLGYWYDGVNGLPNPYDDHGHGTHTMGTMVGGDGPGTQFPDENDVGIAYGAKFVAAKGFSSSGIGEDPWILGCYEFLASLIDSGVNLRIVSNSWGSSLETDLTFWDATMNWRNLGIIPVFAIGNYGPSSHTTNTPGNFPIVIGVGATDSNDNIASFSSRGPAPNQSPWNDQQYWPRPDWNLIKPNISAPGVEVRSTVPGGGYESSGWSGTSMATPHVAGAIALMLEMNPAIDFDMIYDILLNSVDEPPQGGTYPNNDYGWGRLNILRAIENTPPLDQPYVKVVSFNFDDSSGNNNGMPDPGETIDLYITLKNLGLDVSNVSVTISTTDTSITILDNTSSISYLAQGDTATGDPMTFTSSPNRRPGMPAGFSVQITGVDTAGNPYTRSDSIFFNIGVPSYTTWAYEDFEQGFANWSTGGTSQWALTTGASHSPSHSATDSPGGDYNNNADNYMMWKFPIDLTDSYYARLIFWTKYDLEQGFDYAYVEISGDTTDPSSWQSLTSFNGTQNAWVPETLSLNNFTGGGPYFIRFHLVSDMSVTRDGIYVDDIAFQKDEPLTGVYVYMTGSEISDSVGGNNNGQIDPGESIQVFVTLQNMGSDPATNTVGTLFGNPDYVTITDNSADFGTINGNGGTVTNYNDPFEFQVSSDAPLGYQFSLGLAVTSDQSTDTFSLNFRVLLGGQFLVWDPDPNNSSGPFIRNILENNLGLQGDYTTDLAPYLDFLQNYQSIFVTVGVYSDNYIIPNGSPEANALVSYAQNGGNLYLEGGDVWYYDPQSAGGYDFGPLFGINATSDGTGDLYNVSGVSGTFTENMSFDYNGENSWIDHIDPASGNAFAILYNPSQSYNCGVANVGNYGGTEYRTVGLSFELSGLIDGSPPSTREELLRQIMMFFGIMTDVDESDGTNNALTFSLAPLQPSIINRTTTVKFALPRKADVSLKVYDPTGRIVDVLLNGKVDAGLHTLSYKPHLPGGVYFMRFTANHRNISTRKFLILR